jgi:hypothetical protein
MSIESARKALTEYLEVVLMDDANPQGEALRDALFAERDERTRARLRERLVREAEIWGPGTPEWRSVPQGEDTLYAGRVMQLYGEVLVGRDGSVARATVSLD